MLPASRDGNILIWIAFGVVTAGWLAVTLARPGLATFGQTLGVLARWWILRWALLAGWAWLGWHVFVRGSW